MRKINVTDGRTDGGGGGGGGGGRCNISRPGPSALRDIQNVVMSKLNRNRVNPQPPQIQHQQPEHH